MYCPPGSAQPTICPAGTFNSLIGQGSCNICPVGFFCPSGSSQATLCPAGTFFDQTNGKAITDCIQCPKGHYCPMGSVQSIACPVGTILSLTGAASVSECKVCPCGFYCDSTGLEQPTGNCYSGKFLSWLLVSDQYIKNKNSLLLKTTFNLQFINKPFIITNVYNANCSIKLLIMLFTNKFNKQGTNS
jgi:hypothetical protein